MRTVIVFLLLLIAGITYGQRAILRLSDTLFRQAPRQQSNTQQQVIQQVQVTQAAQTDGLTRSQYGLAHTPSGRLHMLLIFAVFDDATAADDVSGWSHDGLPQYATSGKLIASGINGDKQIQNLSNWFSTCSGNAFTITGEIFKVKIRKLRAGSSYDFYGMYRECFEALDKQYPGEDWSRFDNRQNNPAWHFDNSRFCADGSPAKGDGIIDYCVINFRLWDGPWSGFSNQDLFSNYSIRTSNKSYRLGAGHTAHYMTPDIEHHLDYFRHEFAHVLFDAPHYMGANNLPGKRFYTNKGWGIMGETHKPINTVNAWEAWWLGWMKPQTITRSGTYALGDFITSRDAIRVKIPNSNLYLWIENHQKRDPFDDKLFYKAESPMAAGIYMFISTAGNDSTRPSEFYCMDNRNTNAFKILHPGGNADFGWKDSLPYRCFSRMGPNIVSGQNEQTLIRQDFNHNRTIAINTDWNNEAAGRNEQDGVLCEDNVTTYAWSGQQQLAFREGDEIGLSAHTIVSNFPFYDEQHAMLDPYILYPVSVLITAYDETTGRYQLDISMSDVRLRRSATWAGRICIPDHTRNRQPDLEIGAGDTLYITHSGTPDRHTFNPLTQGFYANGAFMIDSNATINAGRQSVLFIGNTSGLELGRQARLNLGVNAQLILPSANELRMNESASINLEEGASIVLTAGHISYTCRAKQVYRQSGKNIQLISNTPNLHKLP